jgi:transcription antitermination protein NusB
MIGGRREARMWAVQFLFQRDFNHGELDDALTHFLDERKVSAKARRYVDDVVRGVEARRSDLDARLQQYAQNWDVRRMGAVERNVMRVALYEMLCRPDIPPVVSINEAVELAKDLSSEDSGKFVNGLLDRARKDISRPARAAEVANAPNPDPPGG